MILPSRDIPWTPAICEIRHGIERKAIIFSESGSETISLEVGDPQEKLSTFFEYVDRNQPGDSITRVEIYFPSPLLMVPPLHVIFEKRQSKTHREMTKANVVTIIRKESS